jgi:hypothetical protein
LRLPADVVKTSPSSRIAFSSTIRLEGTPSGVAVARLAASGSRTRDRSALSTHL